MKYSFWPACLAAAALFAVAPGAAAEDAPPAAKPSSGTVVEIKPQRIFLMDVARAGDRLVSVGERGFVLLSDDGGRTWRAIGTPVNRTLTGVAFEDAKTGVAVGHGASLVRTEDGDYFAVDNTCSHALASLAEGWVEEQTIECPLHSASFCLKSGEALSLPATEPVGTHKLELRGDEIWLYPGSVKGEL